MAANKPGPLETVTYKGTSVFIYDTPHTKHGKTYAGYTLVYTQAGRRMRKCSNTLAKAKSLAKRIAEQLSEGLGHVAALSSDEIADYRSASQILRKCGDVSLASVCQQYVDAMERLGGYGSLREAVEAYMKARETHALPEIEVPKLLKKFLEAKEREGLSEYYVKDIGRKLRRFASAFECSIASIGTPDIKQWLSRQGKGRTNNNLRSAISTLFSFAKESGYLPKNEQHAAELVSKVNEKPSNIGIYTPDEMARILSATDSEMVPTLAIAAFAGLRSSEIFRLDWQYVNLSRSHIALSAEKTKTASRRIVPITPNLKEWLRPHVKKHGRVTPSLQNLDNLTRKFSAICEDAEVTVQRNGFRHSFASYRLADIKSAAEVALEMGTSPQKLFTNYRELVTEEDAKVWFSILP